MGLIADFNKELSLWFNNHGISNLDFTEGEDFCYYPDLHTVQYSLFDSPVTDNHFIQFAYEYGMIFSCHPFVLSLLHEVGHFETLHLIDFEVRFLDTVAKQERKVEHISIDNNYWYWELPTEFAANLWAINWVNNNFSLLQELHDFCSDWLDKIFSDQNIVQQLADWLENIEENHEYAPLSIYED